MIQTEIRNDRGELEQLDHHDPRYWNGPYRYEPFPKAVYRAGAGKDYQTPEIKVVKNEAEWRALGSDWKEGPDEARAHRDRLDADMARAAAERIASDRTMSPRAQAEAEKADRATDEMLAEIPEARRRKGV